MKSIDWQNLRPFKNSRNSAFEELCCQLAAYEPMPQGSIFRRKAAPDAGVECFWQLPNSTEFAWQAKFFPDLGDSQWTQLDKSIKTALKKHPKLVSYTVCLPIDLRDPRLENRIDLMSQWDIHVEKWRGWAKVKGMSVEFPYWGEHQIWERLSREENRGRYFFWFNKEFFSKPWLSGLIDVAVANAGPRYTPELHVELHVAKVFDGLGRTKAFYNQIRILHGKLKKTRNSLRLENPDPIAAQSLTELNGYLKQLFPLLEKLPEAGIEYIDFPAIAGLCNHINTDAWQARGLLDEVKRSATTTLEDQDKSKQENYNRDIGAQKHYLWELINQTSELAKIAKSQSAQLANVPALLLVGEAGSGKSHLFCDVAKQRVANGLPTVLLLGENFSTEEPWSQVTKMLGITCGKEELLGALDAAAQATDAKALIMIDALNEGEGKQLWQRTIAGILTTLIKFPRVGLAISVRSSYESTVIPEGLVPNKLIRVEHSGFAGYELEATKTFFDYYGIKAPSVPLLTPEFNNPLFLKLFCKGLKNKNLTEVPKGLQGIIAIFDFFIESANDKLSQPQFLDYDPSSQPVKRAINALVDQMVIRSETWIPREEAKATVEAVLSSGGWDKSFFRHLISEGLIAEDRRLLSWENEEWADIVHFSYERLSDHLVTNRLLDQHLDINNPFTSFSTKQPLGALVKDERACWMNRGIIEALCIQLPERIGKELFDLAPQCAKWHSVLEAYIESLIWRSPKAFGKTYRKYLNKAAGNSRELYRQFLNGLLTVATNPDHSLNADFLDRRLKKDSMAERDAWWSIFLHNDYTDYESSAIRRLVDWAWSASEKSHIDDESLRLCGVALAWFLTSSNRFLRDRATKALVSLSTPRISVFRQLLYQFQEVNDVYVLERLYAAAYGCVMRSHDIQEIGSLALDVYKQVFEDGSPPIHILLRDYARGVIEIAICLGVDLPIDVERILPPYQSEWLDDIPSKDEVEIWRKKLSGSTKFRGDIYNSVMEWGDFARYVIGTNSGSFEWTARKLSEATKPTRKEIYNNFVNSLTSNQQKDWERYINIRANFDYFLRSDESRRREVFGEDITEEVFRLVLTEVEKRLRKKLGKRKGELLENHVIPYLNNPNRQDENRFDLSIAQRFVLKRVAELGWEQRLFEEFDNNVNRFVDTYRSAHKAERIGKKYQWIAWHEFLARVADNFEYKSDEWSGRKEVYEGPWQDSIRDIDPSCLLKKTNREVWRDYSITWWSPITHNDWGTDWIQQQPDEEWVKRSDNLPDFGSLIEVVNPKYGSKWLSLDSFYKWEQPIPVGEDRYEGWYKEIWVILNSYLVKKTDSDEVFEWAQEQDFFGRWMSESHELYKVFLGEFFWSPAYRYFNIPYYHHEGWSRGRNERVPKPLYALTEEYASESQGFDCSIDDSFTIKLPCSLIANEMKLNWRGVEGEFYDENLNLIAFDPSVRSAGTGTLLIHKEHFINFLEERDYDVIWTLLGEKMSFCGGYSSNKQIGRLIINGAYRTKQGKVTGGYSTKFDESWASKK